MSSSSSSQFHLVLCLFLLSFLAVNSGRMYPYFFVFIRNDLPNTVEGKYCNGGDREDYCGNFSMKLGQMDTYVGPKFPQGNYTLTFDIKYEERYGFFKLFDSNDMGTCHINHYICRWIIRQEGMCMVVDDKCDFFKWNYTQSTKNIASEQIGYITNNP